MVRRLTILPTLLLVQALPEISDAKGLNDKRHAVTNQVLVRGDTGYCDHLTEDRGMVGLAKRSEGQGYLGRRRMKTFRRQAA